MRRHTRTAQLLRIVVTVLQLMLPGALSTADALLERDAASSSALSRHVDGQDAPSHARVHALECALCQYLATAHIGARRLALALPTTDVRFPPAEYAPAHGRADGWRAPLPRGPPVS